MQVIKMAGLSERECINKLTKYAEYLRRENVSLEKEIKELRKQNEKIASDMKFVRNCLYAALERTKSSLVLNRDFFEIHTGEESFFFDENLESEPILRIVKK